MLVWCSWVSSPKEIGMPGQQLFAGTHVNANVTWWNKSQPFFDYINRCQAMMQQGLFVADVAYYCQVRGIEYIWLANVGRFRA